VLDPAFSINHLLARRLRRLVEVGDLPAEPQPDSNLEFDVFAAPGALKRLEDPVDVVITANEINDRHGTGPLVKRVFGDRANVFSIRSKNDWGAHDFGHWSVCLPQSERPRPECYRRVTAALGNRRVGHVLCVPFLADEFITAIAVRDAYQARLCSWLMDDQNVAASNVPDKLVAEYLEKCSLRLFTHPELRAAYQRKYGLEAYILPAVVPGHLVLTQPIEPAEPSGAGALIGSFWDQMWFDRTCDAFEGCGWRIDWFGNNESPWVRFPKESLERAGIRAMGLVPEERLAEELRRYPFVVVPAGTLEKKEENTGVARLSLPGRILFTVAVSHTPVLILGSQKTCGARFVRHFGLGAVVPYDSAAIRAAIEELVHPSRQQEIRRNAAAIASRLSADGVGQWLRQSIDQGRPADDRFESLFLSYDTAEALDALDIRPYRVT